MARVRSAQSPVHRLLSIWSVLLVLATLGLAACGGDDDVASKSAPDILKASFGPDEPVQSGLLDVALGLDAKGLQGVDGPVTLTLKGPFTADGKDVLPSFDFDAALVSNGQTIQAGAVSTGQAGYLKLQGQAFDLGPELFKQFKDSYAADAKQSATSKAPTFKTLGIDPTRWLRDPTKAGEERIGDVDTVHVKAAVDVPALLDDVNRLLGKAEQLGVAKAAGQTAPQQLTDAQRTVIAQAITSTGLDVWARKSDGALRQVKLAIAFAVPKAAQAAANGLTGGTLTLDLGIDQLNRKQTITAPTGARPLTDLTQAAAAAQSGGTTGTQQAAPDTATQAAPDATTQAPQDPAYEKCAKAAGGDLLKLRDCVPSGG